MKGRNRLIAAPRMMPNRVGGWYRTSGGELVDGGEVEMSSPAEYCSLSERMVTPDSAIGFEGSSDAIARVVSRASDRGRVKCGTAITRTFEARWDAAVAGMRMWTRLIWNLRSWRASGVVGCQCLHAFSRPTLDWCSGSAGRRSGGLGRVTPESQ